MACQRCLEERIPGVVGPHGIHRDHVRVGPERRADGRGDGHATCGLDLDLAQTGVGRLDRVLDTPDLALGRIDGTEDGAERGGGAGARRASAEEQASGFGRDRMDGVQVPLGETELVQRHGRARRQEVHHQVLVRPGRRERGDAQGDLSVVDDIRSPTFLGRAPLGEIESGHGLAVSHQGQPLCRRHRRMLDAQTVHPETNDARPLAALRLEVHVRRPDPAGVTHDLIGDSGDGCLARLPRLTSLVLSGLPHRHFRLPLVGHLIRRVFRGRFADQRRGCDGDRCLCIDRPARRVRNGRIVRRATGRAGHRVEESQDIRAQTDGEPDRPAREGPLDILDTVQVIWVVAQDMDAVLVVLQGNPAVVPQGFGIHAVEQSRIEARRAVVFDEGAPVELAEGLPDVRPGDLVLLQQDRFDVNLTLLRLPDRLLQIGLGDPVVGHQIVELGGDPPGDLESVEKRDPQCLGEFGDRVLVLLGESSATLLVHELYHPHQILAIGHDGVGQDLLGAESALPVPGAVERERRADGAKLGAAVRVRDVHGAAELGSEAGDALLADGDADLADLVDIEKLGVDLAPFGVHDVQGQQLRVEHLEDLILEVHHDVVQILGRMDPIDDLFDVFRAGDFLLEFFHPTGTAFGLHVSHSPCLPAQVHPRRVPLVPLG